MRGKQQGNLIVVSVQVDIIVKQHRDKRSYKIMRVSGKKREGKVTSLIEGIFT